MRGRSGAVGAGLGTALVYEPTHLSPARDAPALIRQDFPLRPIDKTSPSDPSTRLPRPTHLWVIDVLNPHLRLIERLG